MLELIVNPEFQSKVPPLTDAEYRQLEENIVSAGEIYEPIVVWNGTIVDGHNRYKIYLAHPEIPVRTREMNFADKWEAFDWMYKNQLGRRNLTDEQRTYLIGKLYETRKRAHGSNRYTMKSDQSGHSKVGRIKEQIASDMKIGQGTVQRAEIYSRGIDAIKATEPELADEILTAKRKVSKTDIQEIGNAEPEKREKMVRRVKEGKPAREKDDENLSSIVESLSDEVVMEYTVTDLTEQIRVNAEAFIRSLSNLLMDHADICNENRPEIIKAIDENILNRIIFMKERLNNGTQL